MVFLASAFLSFNKVTKKNSVRFFGLKMASFTCIGISLDPILSGWGGCSLGARAGHLLIGKVVVPSLSAPVCMPNIGQHTNPKLLTDESV